MGQSSRFTTPGDLQEANVQLRSISENKEGRKGFRAEILAQKVKRQKCAVNREITIVISPIEINHDRDSLKNHEQSEKITKWLWQ
jgi:hypothetical protein